MKSASPGIAVAGFRNSGICPLNPAMIPEKDYTEIPTADLPTTSTNENQSNDHQNDELPVANVSTKTSQCSSSNNADVSFEIVNTSFKDIQSVLVLSVKCTKRKGEESEQITGSPYKKRLEESIEKQNEKEKVVPEKASEKVSKKRENPPQQNRKQPKKKAKQPKKGALPQQKGKLPKEKGKEKQKK